MRPRLIIAAMLVAAFAGSGLLWSHGLLGSHGGEVYGHAWVQWWHADALPSWPAGTDLAEGTARWPVIDPLPTLIAACVGRLAGVIVGYNTWILLSIMLAFLGGSFLAQREEGDPWVGGLALAMAPALAGSLTSGLTEDGGVGLIAAGLALIGARDLRRGLLAGLLLGLAAACGLVSAWAAAVVAVGFSLWAARDRTTWKTSLIAGVVAALCTLPVAWPFLTRLGGAGHHSGTAFEAPEPLWRLNPWRGVDLASFLAPGKQEIGDALVRMHPGYLGLSLLVLAAFSGRSRWWWVLLGAVVVAPGRRLSWMGQPLGLDNPFAAAAHALPLGDLLNHHGRLLLIGAIAIAALASKGAQRLILKARRPDLIRAVILTIIAADLLFLSPVSIYLPIAEADPPDVASQLGDLSPGALLILPVAGPGVHPQRALLDQRAHGRHLLISPNRPGLPERLKRDPSARWLASLGGPQATRAPSPLDPPEQIAVLLVAPDLVPTVTAVLGPAQVTGRDGAAWDLRARPATTAPDAASPAPGVSSPP